jgi:hypothetical protein
MASDSAVARQFSQREQWVFSNILNFTPSKYIHTLLLRKFLPPVKQIDSLMPAGKLKGLGLHSGQAFGISAKDSRQR